MTTSTTRSQAFIDISADIDETVEIGAALWGERGREYRIDRAGMILAGILKCVLTIDVLTPVLSHSEAEILRDRVADEIWEF